MKNCMVVSGEWANLAECQRVWSCSITRDRLSLLLLVCWLVYLERHDCPQKAFVEDSSRLLKYPI